MRNPKIWIYAAAREDKCRIYNIAFLKLGGFPPEQSGERKLDRSKIHFKFVTMLLFSCHTHRLRSLMLHRNYHDISQIDQSLVWPKKAEETHSVSPENAPWPVRVDLQRGDLGHGPKTHVHTRYSVLRMGYEYGMHGFISCGLKYGVERERGSIVTRP